MNITFKIAVFLTFTSTLIFSKSIQATDLESLRAAMEEEIETVNLTEALDDSYRKSLVKLKADYQQKGNLEALLEVKEEEEAFAERGVERPLSNFPELKRLQSIYRTELSKRNKGTREAIITVLKKYELQAANLTKQLTKGGYFDVAKLSNEEVARIRGKIAKLEEAKGKSLPFGVQGEVYTDKHECHAGWAHLTKNNTYKFDIRKVTGQCILTIEADKLASSSNGEFILKFGEKEPHVIGSWTMEEFKSGRMKTDVSKWVTKPGNYVVEAKWKSGELGLRIQEIKMDTREK